MDINWRAVLTGFVVAFVLGILAAWLVPPTGAAAWVQALPGLIDVLTALKAMTIWPAWQHYEEHWKGSIEPGKLADLVVLSADPTAVDPETLDQLKVLETVKDGETVFTLESAGAATTRPPSNPAVARLLVALGAHGAGSGHDHDHSAASGASAAAPTCMSDGILHLATAMLGGFAATEE